MTVGNKSYNFIQGGSTATSAATAHRLFGIYQGISSLGNSDVVLVSITASTGNYLIALDSGTTAVSSLIDAAIAASKTILFDPIRVGRASDIAFRRIGANNPIVYWSIWARNPL